MLCLVRLSVPSDSAALIDWIERNRIDLRPWRGPRNPDGSLPVEVTVDLPDPDEGAAFAREVLAEAAEGTGYTGKLPIRVELWSLDDSPVKPGEPDPILLTMSLPFCVHLQNGTYSMAFGGELYNVKLEKVWRNSQGSSTDDSVSNEPRRFESGSLQSPTIGRGPVTSPHLGTNIEIKEDPHGRYRYTRMTIQLDGQADGEPEVPMLVESVLPIVNRFVDVYRYVTGRAYLPPVQIEDIEVVELVRPARGEGQYVFLFGHGHEIALINEPRSVHDRVIDMLLKEEEVPLYADLLLAAKRLLAQGAWRQAVVEAVVALEVFVDRFLHKELTERQGMPEAEFEALMRKDGQSLSDRMKRPMRQAISWSPANETSDLWERWLAVNAVRRRVVHGGTPVTRVEASEAIEVCGKLISSLERAALKAGNI